MLSGCSGLGFLKTAASVVGGSTPGVSANVQAGAENKQAVVSSDKKTTIRANNGASVDSSQSQVKAGSVSKVTINQTPLWIVLLLIIGWVLPSPNEIARWFYRLFKKN